MNVMIVLQRHPELFEIIRALRAPRRFARCLHRRQQQGDQDADDGNHYK